jgi:hypothetical protein
LLQTTGCVDAIEPDFDPAEQRHEHRLEFIWRLACEFFGDLTAAFDQLVLLRANLPMRSPCALLLRRGRASREIV